MMQPFRYIKNFFFCLKYPFMKVYHRWTGKFMGYEYTEYDNIPEGWRKAFGKQLLNDIKKAGEESRKRLGKNFSWHEMIQWEDIKEKYGTLHLYAAATSEIREVLDKYELMSREYCMYCGKPAKYVTEGWVEYLCEDCYNKFNYKGDKKDAN